MSNITVIFSSHKMIGLCNSFELYKIIECINPDLIFEELSEEVFDRCYIQRNMSTVETDAISEYVRVKNVKHIPVVDKIHEIEAKINFMIKAQSYRILYNELIMMEGQYGFPFLNSIECEMLFDRIIEMEQTILKENNNYILYEICNQCDMDIDRYENEIINNIYHYSSINSFDSAILLIGAAHRKSFLNKINVFDNTSDFKLNWKIYKPAK